MNEQKKKWKSQKRRCESCGKPVRSHGLHRFKQKEYCHKCYIEVSNLYLIDKHSKELKKKPQIGLKRKIRHLLMLDKN